MAITYTTFLTETPDAHTRRVYRGYDIPGGMVFNTIIKINPSQGDNRVADKEIFIPSATTASLAGLSWTTVDNVDLGNGQKRIVRQYILPAALGRIVELQRTIKFNNLEQVVDISTLHAV